MFKNKEIKNSGSKNEKDLDPNKETETNKQANGFLKESVISFVSNVLLLGMLISLLRRPFSNLYEKELLSEGLKVDEPRISNSMAKSELKKEKKQSINAFLDKKTEEKNERLRIKNDVNLRYGLWITELTEKKENKINSFKEKTKLVYKDDKKICDSKINKFVLKTEKKYKADMKKLITDRDILVNKEKISMNIIELTKPTTPDKEFNLKLENLKMIMKNREIEFFYDVESRFEKFPDQIKTRKVEFSSKQKDDLKLKEMKLQLEKEEGLFDIKLKTITDKLHVEQSPKNKYNLKVELAEISNHLELSRQVYDFNKKYGKNKSKISEATSTVKKELNVTLKETFKYLDVQLKEELEKKEIFTKIAKIDAQILKLQSQKPTHKK